jgi:hypothetical protein
MSPAAFFVSDGSFHGPCLTEWRPIEGRRIIALSAWPAFAKASAGSFLFDSKRKLAERGGLAASGWCCALALRAPHLRFAPSNFVLIPPQVLGCPPSSRSRGTPAGSFLFDSKRKLAERGGLAASGWCCALALRAPLLRCAPSNFVLIPSRALDVIRPPSPRLRRGSLSHCERLAERARF